MSERGWIEPIVERVVGQVLDSHLAQLRTEIVRRVMEEVAAAPADEPVPVASSSKSGAEDLARAVAEIQLGSSQREILRALLDTSARYANRVALFVVKGTHATGWQGRGFANSDAIKDFKLDESAPAVARAITERANGAASADFDSHFLEQFGAPSKGDGRLLPLILKDKVAALVYADGGTDESSSLDAGSLELLVLSTGAWLEVNSLRKQSQKESSPAQADAPRSDAAPVEIAQAAATAPAFNDPFASHAPHHVMAAAASGGGPSTAAVASETAVGVASQSVDKGAIGPQEVQSAVASMEPALAEPIPVGHIETATPPEASAAPALSPEDQDVHRKAQRFARLLVDEIKLYNQAKVAEGRKNKDLYDRLKEAIEKSRGTYQKRYGNTVAASGNYFQHEIIRSLAADDLSAMGSNFRH
jgi:hypothetical protein